MFQIEKAPKLLNLGAFLSTPWEFLFWATVRLPVFEF
jgi:hypothetical protein